MDLTRKFYETLFNDDEWTCFADYGAKGIRTYPAISKGLKEENEYFSINPMRPQSTRAGDNVVILRNILVEIDKDNNGVVVPPEQQLDWFEQIGLPYATLVWSAGKSYHAIISVEDGIPEDEWERLINAIYKVLSNNKIPNDASVKDKPRLSRCANSLRFDTKQFQTVKEVRRRITREELDNWLATHNVCMEPKKVERPSTYVSGSNDGVSSLKLFEEAKEWTTKSKGIYSSSHTTGGHMWLFAFGINTYKLDLNPDTAINLAITEWGQRYLGSTGGGLVSTVIKAGWEFAKQKAAKQYKRI